MINQISLHNFKCFELLKLPLKQFTLLAGTNASGKSSVLQALVLLHQTSIEHEWATRLMLNGNVLRLGTVSDVIDKIHGRTTFEIGLSDEESTCHWKFSEERSQMSMEIQEIMVNETKISAPNILHFLLPYNPDIPRLKIADKITGLTYITAERVGPREFYSLIDAQAARVVGCNGEHAVSVLFQGKDEPVIEALVLENSPPTRLRQVEARMREFFPGFGLDLQQIPNTNAVTLGLRMSDATSYHRPIHVGFGITQIFPIIVAALSATRGDVLLIENPEVHLHPAGQAKMGFFLAKVAASGIQVIVESHSDHILNGLRRAVKETPSLSDLMQIHFFRPRTNDLDQVTSPNLLKSGDIDDWPEGFFDQFEKDINYFAGWGN